MVCVSCGGAEGELAVDTEKAPVQKNAQTPHYQLHAVLGNCRLKNDSEFYPHVPKSCKIIAIIVLKITPAPKRA